MALAFYSRAIELDSTQAAIYEEFCGLFEEQMEKLIGEVNPKASADDFIKALKAASEMQAEDEQGSIADVMIASSEFPVFVKLEKTCSIEQKEEEEGEADSKAASNSASCTSSKAEAFKDLETLKYMLKKFFANLMTIEHIGAKTC